jgi:hypothetical protein
MMHYCASPLRGQAWLPVIAGHAEDVGDPELAQTRQNVLNSGLGHL